MQIENDIFSCIDICSAPEEIKVQIYSFKAVNKKGEGVVDYLKSRAIEHTRNRLATTYLVVDRRTNELAGFFSLKLGMVPTNEKGIFKKSFDGLPGIELMNFAVNKVYADKYQYKGIGKIIYYDFILHVINEIDKCAAIKVFYLFALPDDDLINYYHDTYGFNRMSTLKAEKEVHKRIRPRYDDGCVFMYKTL